MNKMITCPSCNGDKDEHCYECNGDGLCQSCHEGCCTECNGTGLQECSECDGSVEVDAPDGQ